MTIRPRWYGSRSTAAAVSLFAVLHSARPAPGQQAPAGRRALTVADAIETTRLMTPPNTWIKSSDGKLTPLSSGDVVVSPSGRRWVAMLIRGDLKKNGNWLELIGGSLESLEAAATVETVARLFTTSLGDPHGAGASQLTLSHFNPIRWIDDDTVAFFFSEGTRPVQAVTADMRTGDVRPLTDHPTEVVTFNAHRSGAVAYAARVARSPGKSEEMIRRGFAVAGADALALLRGDVDGYTGLDSETFIATGTPRTARRIASNSRGVDRWVPIQDPLFSPDGRQVLVEGSPDEVPENWIRYTDELFRTSIEEAQRDRDGFYARFVKQIFVAEVGEGVTARPLWAVPNTTRLKTVWSPDGRSVLLVSTYLPVENADADGLAGRAVAEVDVATGRFSQLPIPPDVAARGMGNPVWHANGVVEVGDGSATYSFRNSGGRWRPVRSARAKPSRPPTPAIRIELRQDLNTPPVLFAVETAGKGERMILDLNPRLRTDFTLGRVEHVTWPDPEGRTWSGLLYHPVGEAPGRRYPLVIQTHGHAPPTAFSLYGTGPGELALGLGPSFSVFAAQPLANRGIAVLQVEDKDSPDLLATPKEPEAYMAAYEAAIEKLVAGGLVDRDRVGIVGYSRTGWHVEYALTHSQFSYAAAITSDNLDVGYMQSLLLWTDEFTKDTGAAPFGEGLKVWLERAPGFNADKVRAPLRLQLESGGLGLAMAKWEMFSRLRQLKKPVELYIVPDIEHGSHSLQNPAQCLASQQGAVDWFDFWLNGREDPDPSRAEQYVRWRELRKLHEASLRSKP